MWLPRQAPARLRQRELCDVAVHGGAADLKVPWGAFPVADGALELHGHCANEMSPAPRPTSRHPEESLHVAIAGPVLTEPLAQFLEGDADRLPAGVGGASSVVWQLVSDLVSRGQRVSVVTLDQAVSAPVIASGPLLDVVYGPVSYTHLTLPTKRIV